MIEKLKPIIKGFDEKPKMPNAYEHLDKINEFIEAINPILEERESRAADCEEEIEFQKSQFVWHLLELVEMTSVKLQDRISELIKEYDCIFNDNKQKGE